jgi:hypothetical protein
MSHEAATEVPFHPEFKSALEKLHRLFGRDLWDVKLKTCFAASSEVKRARSARKKVEIVNREFDASVLLGTHSRRENQPGEDLTPQKTHPEKCRCPRLMVYPSGQHLMLMVRA